MEEEPVSSESESDMERAKTGEGQRLLKCADGHVVALCIEGKKLSSTEIAQYITSLPPKGVSRITFIIGGSYGLSDEVASRCNFRLSFGKNTYPHQLMRLILCEQIYRAFMIAGGGTCHK